jgi:ferric-dicitrate binding protein FerR (iron transport regulator)
MGELRNDPKVDTEASWKRFLELKAQNTSTAKSIKWQSWIGRAAAVSLVVTGLGYAIWNYQEGTSEQVVAAQLESVSDIALPDGTKVWLNKHSQISYAKNFGDSGREVNLEGEAYFEVVRNPEIPFIIGTGVTEVKVLGTSFNVRTTTDQTEVVVASGTVAFYEKSNPTGKVTLQQHDKGTYYSLTDRLNKTKNQDPNYLSWKTGRLIFDHMTLGQVVASLEHHYHQQITLANQDLANCRINTRFDQQPLPEVIEEVCLLLGFNYEFNSQGYLIKGAGCK